MILQQLFKLSKCYNNSSQMKSYCILFSQLKNCFLSALFKLFFFFLHFARFLSLSSIFFPSLYSPLCSLFSIGLGMGLRRSRRGLGFARRSRLRRGGLRRSQRGLEFAQRSRPGRGFALISAWSWVCSTISVWVWVCANLGVVVYLRRSRRDGGAVGVIEERDEEREKKMLWGKRKKVKII